MSSLFVIQGRDQGRRFELDEQVISIGRDSVNQFQLHDTEVSRVHAEIQACDDGFYLVDKGSSNGSFVNSFRADRQLLKSGDRIQIGRTLMIFTASDSSASKTQSGVDIVGHAQISEQSRIIKSLSHSEGSQLLTQRSDDANDPWLARARSNLQIMYSTALAVSHTLDIDQLLDRIMELIFEWVEADRGCVLLVDRETQQLSPKARRDRNDETVLGKLEISQTIIDFVQSKQEGVLTSNARDDERWDSAASIVKLGVREAICVPMQGRYGMVGIIYIDTFSPPERLIVNPTKKKFNEEHLKLMIAIGHQAALAVEDTSYYSAMVQAERLAAVGQAIAGLSHHVKNILQGIRGGSYLIEEGLKSSEYDVARKGWKIVEKNQDKISRLVLDMLTFSKERKPEMRLSSLNDVVVEVFELMESRCQEAGVGFTKVLDESIPESQFDPEGIHRAILNIVSNAIDACDEGQQVEIATKYHRESSTLVVCVSDTGMGIAESDVARIFTVFESDKGNRGTGLGLPVSQKIVREHGGEIRVSSQKGRGSQFSIEIPAIIGESPI